MNTETLVQQAQNKRYADFDKSTKEILKSKVAQALADRDYFSRLDTAKGILEGSDKGKSDSYKEFYAKMLKKFNVKSPDELDDAKKKKFYDAFGSFFIEEAKDEKDDNKDEKDEDNKDDNKDEDNKDKKEKKPNPFAKKADEKDDDKNDEKDDEKKED